MAQDYHITVSRPEDGCVIVAVTGKIDIASSLSFGERLCAVLSQEATKVVVDLSAASYLDTTGLSVLWESAKRCRREGRQLVIVCSAGGVRSALATSALDQVVATHATLDEALGHGRPAL
jgi:anti-sigma B factor antagonist